MNKYLNLVYTIFVVLFAIILFSYPTNVFNACKFGLTFWYSNILPSLFPFMIVTGLMLESSLLIKLIHALFSKVMEVLFRVSGVGSLPVILGMFCGFPVGAKLTADLYDKKLLSLTEAERLISFSNNCGPIFIISVVCLQLLDNIEYAPFIIFVQILSALSVGIIFRNYKKNVKPNKKSNKLINTNNTPKSISKILNENIINSAYNVINIGSFIVFYSVLLEVLHVSNISNIINVFFIPIENLLNIEPSLSGKLAVGMIEISTGVNSVAMSSGSILQKLLLINIIINWGSFSVHSQTNNILQKSNICFKPYIIGKLLQTGFCILYTILFCLF
ncbi:MAG TPA: hypothetical protein DCP90_06450 [Clostridiales bacterium]|nr:MAG: hypothetical protein A2Y22_00825 [Clostridiales bacterium GWD2_32_59]HAN10235.1 hypothetical protein [Clostridiales bacterium]